MHLPLISFLTELWHLLDVSEVAGYGTVLASFLLYVYMCVCAKSIFTFSSKLEENTGQSH